LFGLLSDSGNPTQVAVMMKSDARADVLAENARLADDFIMTLFAVVYEVYGSSVCSCFCYSCWCFCLHLSFNEGSCKYDSLENPSCLCLTIGFITVLVICF